jgi:transposase
MTRPYSTDLRERAVAAVENGQSRRQVAKLFKVGEPSVIRWCVEMRFAHLKTHHRFERMRLRGLTGARDEFNLAAIV